MIKISALIKLIYVFFILTLVACGAESGNGNSRVVEVRFDQLGLNDSISKPLTLAVQSDEKVIVALKTEASAGSANEFGAGIIRLNPDGSLDSSFGVNGIVTVSLNDRNLTTNGAVTLPNGDIILVGSSQAYPVNNAIQPDSLLIKLQSDGTIDQSFGNDGIIVALTGNNDSTFFKPVIQSDNKTVILTQSRKMLRVNMDGSIDTSFGTAGIVDLNYDNDGITLQGDGKIIVVGNVSGSSGRLYIVQRYDTDGSLDTTFADQGIFEGGIPASSTGLEDVVVDSSGNIIAAGGYTVALSPSGFQWIAELIRLDQNGVLDTSFQPQLQGATGVADTVALFPDGRSIFSDGSQLLVVDPSGEILNDNYPIANSFIGADNDLYVLSDNTVIAIDRGEVYFIKPN